MGKFSVQIFRNNLIKKLLKNAGILLSGQFLVSVFSIITTIITARALGTELFGILIIVQTYILIIDGLMNFQSWQALVKFGTDALENNDITYFKVLLKFILIIDLLTAFLATILALALVKFSDLLLNLNDDYQIYIIIYCFTILFNITGVPTAILRIFGKFKLFAMQAVLVAGFKMLSVIILYLFNFGLFEFVIVWALTDILGYLLLLYFGLKELKRNKYNKFMHIDLKYAKLNYKNLLAFIFTTNISSSVRMASKQFDILIINSMLGNSSVAIYKIAKQFSVVLSKATDPLYQVIYPELTKLVANKKMESFKKLIIQSSIIAGVFAFVLWFIFLFLGDYIILLTVGSEYLEGNSLILWYMLAIVVAVVSFALQPSMLALGFPQHSLRVHLISTFIYFICLPILLHYIGLIGAGISYLIYYLLWSTLMLIFIRKIFKKEEVEDSF